MFLCTGTDDEVTMRYLRANDVSAMIFSLLLMSVSQKQTITAPNGRMLVALVLKFTNK